MASFGITGEFITEHVRNLWYEKDFQGAFDYLTETIPDMNRGQQLDLIEGRMKLIGTNNLDFVEDKDFIKDNEYSSFDNALKRKKESDKLYNEQYEKDYSVGLDIIRYFSEFEKSEKNSDFFENEIERWNQLLDSVRSDLLPKTPYYMSLYFRVFNDVKVTYNGYGGGLTHKTIATNCFPEKAWTDKKLFEKYCEKYYMYNIDEQNEIWDDYHATIKRITTPLKDNKQKKKRKDLNIDSSMSSAYGWLSRDGKYYTCYYTGHNNLSEEICEKFEWVYDKDASMVLENKGWVKIHTPDDHRKGITLFSYINKPSKQQIKKIIQYCDRRGNVYPEFINDIE